MRFFLGMTGASGAIYGARALSVLVESGHDVGLCASPAALQVVGHEMFQMGPKPDVPEHEIMALLLHRFGQGPGTVDLVHPNDLTSRYASGSAPLDGVLIAPCSMSTLGTIATGTGRNLIHRAADVALKERRKLVLVARESPLSEIHLSNMLTATRAGAVVLPAAPGFYNLPTGVADLIDFVVARALDQLAVPHQLGKAWGTATAESA
jgi:4-hydroxy-3-polyprenylbenzoate decarboxylase